VNNQYQAVQNVHDLCRTGGCIIHALPRVGHWRGHCRYHYSDDFAGQLATACNYDILLQSLLDRDNFQAPRNLIAVVLRKNDASFLSPASFQGLGIVDSGDTSRTGNYAGKRPVAMIARCFSWLDGSRSG
jgi:hypothetical protein